MSKATTDQHPLNYSINPIPYGGPWGFLARAIRLAARTLEPFHLEAPKFLTFSFMPFGHIEAKFQVN